MPKLLTRYDYWPIVVDQHFRGLWHFDDYSHEGPILVINGSKAATVVPLLLSKAATMDSLNAALRKYPLAEISPVVRAEIVRTVASIQFLQ
ncbi:hypothetical protein [Hymenobacter sediminicola]|uniref:Uncharacterized protein n=1 Tax=Hymenobacter sediminicola TaxID=2761579 RepID=A0A7G7W2D5_9BACT|nr:hypothetical protein [Hymenobacter sediminicola]QNH60528.1 hypothetical protein H4317_09955 [Hymenobacter sediminicola]